MKRILIGAALAVACLLPTVPASASTMAFSTSQSRFTAGADNQGWWSATASNVNFNDNYTVGSLSGNILHNFFTFDLSSSCPTVTAATLRIQRYGINASGSLTYGLFDVSTSAAVLNDNEGTSSSISDDLGTGTSYGSYPVSALAGSYSDILSLGLNSAGVAAVNAARGDFFSIGGALLGSSGGDYSGGSFAYLFGFSSGTGTQELNVTCADNDAPSVGDIAGSTSADEGHTGTYSVTASDPDSDSLTYRWSVTSGNAQITGPSNAVSASVKFTDGPSNVALRVDVSDDHGHTVTKTLSVSENNVSPSLGALSLSGATATACSTGNDVTLTVSFTDPAGAGDAYTGRIDWGDGSDASFSSSPASAGHHYAAGTYTIEVDVSDEDGGSATQQTAAVDLRYVMSGILQPIKSDSTTVFARKKGSTIPVKVRIMDCSGAPVGNLAPTIGVSQSSSLTDSDPVDKAASTSAADTSGVMRYDASAGQYISNLASTALGVGNWTVYVRQATSNPTQSKASFALR